MRISWLVANQVWCVMLGSEIINVGGQRLFETKEDLIQALSWCGIKVSDGGLCCGI